MTTGPLVTQSRRRSGPQLLAMPSAPRLFANLPNCMQAVQLARMAGPRAGETSIRPAVDLLRAFNRLSARRVRSEISSVPLGGQVNAGAEVDLVIPVRLRCVINVVLRHTHKLCAATLSATGEWRDPSKLSRSEPWWPHSAAGRRSSNAVAAVDFTPFSAALTAAPRSHERPRQARQPPEMRVLRAYRRRCQVAATPHVLSARCVRRCTATRRCRC